MTGTARAISQTGLGYMRRSPELFRRWWLGEYDRPDTPAMARGRMTHALVLQPDTAGRTFVRRPDGIDRRTNAGKQAWADFVMSVGDAMIVDGDDYDLACLVADRVRACVPAAGLLARAATREQRIGWQDAGLDCAGTPDASGDHVLVDLKTCRDSSPDAFRRHAWSLRYDCQAAWYRRGLGLAGLGEPAECYWIAASAEEPYDVGVYQIDESWLRRGHDDNADALAEISDRIATGSWLASQSLAPLPLGMPPWARRHGGDTDEDISTITITTGDVYP